MSEPEKVDWTPRRESGPGGSLDTNTAVNYAQAAVRLSDLVREVVRTWNRDVWHTRRARCGSFERHSRHRWTESTSTTTLCRRLSDVPGLLWNGLARSTEAAGPLCSGACGRRHSEGDCHSSRQNGGLAFAPQFQPRWSSLDMALGCARGWRRLPEEPAILIEPSQPDLW